MKEARQKGYMLYDPIYIKFKLIYSVRKQINVWGLEGRDGKKGLQGNEETFGGSEYIHYLHCDDDFTVYTYVKTYIKYLNMCI